MRKVIIALLGIVALAGLAWVGRFAYRSWKQEHLVKQARYYLSKADVANAVLCLQGALQSNPGNVDAVQMFGDLSEAAGSSAAVSWRKRMVELKPKATPGRLALAKTALLFNDVPTAKDALAGVDADGRKSVEYLKGAAAVAWAAKDNANAESNYREALRLEPTNLISQLNLATVELCSTNAEKMSHGRATLRSLKANESIRNQALRSLIGDAMRDRQLAQAQTYSTELQTDSHSTFADHLQHLAILTAVKSQQVGPYLASIQQESVTNRVKAFELGEWYYQQGRTNDGLAWMGTLPAAVRTNLPMPMLIAEGRATLGQWTELEAITKSGDWRDGDYLRHAFHARAVRARGDSAAAAMEWQAALRAAGKRLDALDKLAHLSAGWGWDAELDQTLWAVEDCDPANKTSFLVLYQRLFVGGNTSGLRNLLQKALTADPADPDLKNNLAIVSLLLNPMETKAHDMAHAVYDKDPKNPVYLSTYAYSLHLQHKNGEALKLYQGLTTEQLNSPPIAAYYGIILKDAGESPKARPYLELAESAKLLPEEIALVKKARQGI